MLLGEEGASVGKKEKVHRTLVFVAPITIVYP
jgi:hypothetical protein